MLELSDVCFAHHGRDPVADGLDIRVPPGELHLLQGPSGAGKSTILRIAAGLIPRVQGGRFAGQVRLAGQPVTAIDPTDLPRRIGWVPQDPEESFVARTVGRELDQLARNLELDDPHQAGARALDALAVGHLADREIAALSGGEAARVSLAAAGLGSPDALVLDEPTAQLDPAGRKQVRAWLQTHRQRGARVLAATHPPHPLAPEGVHRLGEAGSPSPAALPEPEGGKPLAGLAGVVHRWEDGTELGPFDLGLHPGEVVCLTGPNGSGKTTALHLLAGLLDPDEGSVHLLGEPPGDLAAQELARRVAIAFQHPAWHITQDTLAEEVAFTAQRLDCRIDPGEQLARLGLEAYAGEHPWDLSGGERQRLAVATAQAHDPPVLLLDEPTRGLDPDSLQRLTDLLTARVRQGKATIVASHHPWMQELAHRSIHLEGPS